MYRYLLVIMIIILGIYLILPTYEHYDDGVILATRLLGAAKHVRLNKFNRVDEILIKPPLPREGESSCHKTVCPSWIPDTAICYKCQ